MTNRTTTKRKRRMAREPKTGPAQAGENSAAQDELANEQADAGTPKEPGKIDRVLSLLKQPGGATLDQMVEATGWLPHSTRAALTGLRKKGHKVQRTKVDGVSRYHVAEPAPE